MANEDKKVERNWSETNPGINPEERSYNKAVNEAIENLGGWATTTTTTTTT